MMRLPGAYLPNDVAGQLHTLATLFNATPSPIWQARTIGGEMEMYAKLGQSTFKWSKAGKVWLALQPEMSGCYPDIVSHKISSIPDEMQAADDSMTIVEKPSLYQRAKTFLLSALRYSIFKN